MVRKVAFTMVPVRDMARAVAFYGDVLGLPIGKFPPTSPWVEYDLPEGGCIAITTVSGTPSSSAGATVGLEVSDLDALVARLEERGAKLLGDFVKGPRCRMRMVADPEGNALVLHQLDP
jgi:predicted enzyme related to lactoylglutathione lyase